MLEMVAMVAATIQAINYVVKTADFRNGEPYIAGRHVSVEFIASLYVNHGATAEEIAQAQELTPAQVHAALAYYYDHTAEIQAIWAAHESAADQHALSDSEQSAEMDRYLAKMKQQDPARYEQFMRARNPSKRDE
jgi:uncharacterized protein (DUF433 family)